MDVGKRSLSRALPALLSSAAGALALFSSPPAQAGGPLLTLNNGTPSRWTRNQVNSICGTQLVRAGGTVEYRTDSGVLGPLSNTQATALVDSIFATFSNIATADINFVNGGKILSPSNCQPVDVTAANGATFLNSPGENVIIFGEAGFPNCSGGTLGFAGPRDFNNSGELIEGLVVLCGGTVNGVGGVVPFQGVFTHEFGHFVGLDHAQVNGHLADGQSEGFPFPLPNANANALGFQGLYDLFAPFGETVYPFLFGSPSGNSDLAPFFSSGEWVQTLHLDDNIAVSTLYPTADFAPAFLPDLDDTGPGFGAIAGRVFAKDGVTPFSGANVVVRRVNAACPWPPSNTAAAFTGAIPSSGGVPALPPARNDTDCLATAASAVSGYYDFTGDLSSADQVGRFKIMGLPPGEYVVYVENIIDQAVGGSRIGPFEPQLNLETEEFWNLGETGSPSEDPLDRDTVTVGAGFVTRNVDIVINGAGGSTAPKPAPIEPDGNEPPPTPPVVSITSPGAGSTVTITQPGFTLAGTISDAAITQIEVFADGDSIGFFDATNGSFSFNLTFCGTGAPASCQTTPASAEVEVVAQNANGTGQDSIIINFNPDGDPVDPPTVTITQPSAQPSTTLTESSFTLAGTVSDLAVTQVLVSASGGFSQNFPVSGGVFSIDLAFCAQDDDQCNGTQQSETITVRATNAAGSGQDVIDITFDPNSENPGGDTTAPLVTISLPSTVESLSTTERLFSLAGQVDDPTITRVEVFAGDKKLGSLSLEDGTFATSVAFKRRVDPPAQAVLSVRATDESGNVGQDQIIVTLIAPGGDPTGAPQTTDLEIGEEALRGCAVTPEAPAPTGWLVLFGALGLLGLAYRRTR